MELMKKQSREGDGMSHDHHHHDHDHDHSHDEGPVGLALGFRIFEVDGKLFWVEAEIAPYMDEPTELGAALIFHPLDGLDPSADEDMDWPAWPIDIDDDLERGKGSIGAQFASIVRQLHGLDVARLKQYLALAQEIAEEEDEDEG
jgi:hypothetical protein